MLEAKSLNLNQPGSATNSERQGRRPPLLSRVASSNVAVFPGVPGGRRHFLAERMFSPSTRVDDVRSHSGETSGPACRRLSLHRLPVSLLRAGQRWLIRPCGFFHCTRRALSPTHKLTCCDHTSLLFPAGPIRVCVHCSAYFPFHACFFFFVLVVGWNCSPLCRSADRSRKVAQGRLFIAIKKPLNVTREIDGYQRMCLDFVGKPLTCEKNNVPKWIYHERNPLVGSYRRAWGWQTALHWFVVVVVVVVGKHLCHLKTLQTINLKRHWNTL